jgi:hypothetical protein
MQFPNRHAVTPYDARNAPVLRHSYVNETCRCRGKEVRYSGEVILDTVAYDIRAQAATQ